MLARTSSRSQTCLLLLVALAGCEIEAGVDDAFIIGGEVDTGHPAVGAILGPTSQCSGTLVIDSCTVLTAAHCVLGGAYRWFHVGGVSYEVAGIAYHESYDHDAQWIRVPSEYRGAFITTAPKADFGLLKLATCPTHIAPMPLATKGPAAGDEITPIGFGASTPPSQGPAAPPTPSLDDGPIPSDFPDRGAGVTPPVKYFGTNTVLASHGFGTAFTFEALGPSGGATSCFGDSGGPTLRVRDGIEEVLGVHSSSQCIDDPNTELDFRLSYDMAVPKHVSWIKNPSVCHVGETMKCGTGRVRHCRDDGLWSATCAASQ